VDHDEAPGGLELVREFVNTRHIENDTDVFGTADGLTAWLAEMRLMRAGEKAALPDVDRARDLREAIREALAANHDGGPIPDSAVDVLNEAVRAARLGLDFTAEPGWTLRPVAGGVSGALGEVLALVVGSMRDGTWPRLKVCVNDTCRWAFYDRSRARSGKWCSMGVCGNRAKQQAWRQRQQ
jgi:predicted RNA-binding Zn ribbon-like protein